MHLSQKKMRKLDKARARILPPPVVAAVEFNNYPLGITSTLFESHASRTQWSRSADRSRRFLSHLVAFPDRRAQGRLTGIRTHRLRWLDAETPRLLSIFAFLAGRKRYGAIGTG